MADLTIEPVSTPFDSTVTPPGSKSLTNRALVLAALSAGECRLSNVLLADDSAVMLDGLQRLGFDLQIDKNAAAVRVAGQSGRVPAAEASLFCGNSGTTLRFLTALCCLGRGHYRLDGIERMRQRPVGELAALLKNLGARIDYEIRDGFPPLLVRADALAGGIVRFGRSQSSQFLSALLQAAPYARHEVRVDLEPNQTSWPYVAMSLRLMHEFGLTAELLLDDAGDPRQIIVPRGVYAATDYAIEPDASNATYFLAAAAVCPGSRATVVGLGKQSLQGDVGFANLLRLMGAQVEMSADSIAVSAPAELEPIDADLSAMPDTAQTLAVVALFATGTSRLTGLRTLRVKETDRVAALATELTKLGADVTINGDDLTIRPPPLGRLRPAAIDTYNDHRMAMSFAIAGLRSAGVTIKDAECVNKTYPGFFNDLNDLVGPKSESN